jgi:hypothetical protein
MIRVYNTSLARKVGKFQVSGESTGSGIYPWSSNSPGWGRAPEHRNVGTNADVAG